ncbi:MAG: hypothetical protein PVI23_06055 [Maricaulaceae bacterium]|jgi:hypothetical protein
MIGTKRCFGLSLALFGAAGLSACNSLSMSDEPNAGPCPNAFALHDAARIVEFADPAAEEDFENVAFTAEVQSVRSLCRYVGDNPIDADVFVEIGFGRGPAAEERSETYNMWVAVTRTDVAVLEKSYFPITVRFGRNEDRVYREERIPNVIIPRAGESTSGSNFEILVGFELTPEQLEFNRLGKRFTLDAARQVD